MAEMIHYEDDIFYISSCIKNLSKGIHLPVDADFFADKIIEDIYFIDKILAKLFIMLRDNINLIHRNEYLQQLLRAKNQFINLLESIRSGTPDFAENLSSLFPKLREIESEHFKDITQIKKMMSSFSDDEEAEDVISSSEYLELFKQSEDE